LGLSQSPGKQALVTAGLHQKRGSGFPVSTSQQWYAHWCSVCVLSLVWLIRRLCCIWSVSSLGEGDR